MAIQWNHELLNKFIAPGIAQFTECSIPSVSESHPESEFWMANHFLNSALGTHFRGRTLTFAVNLMYRIQTLFAAYHSARAETIEYLAKSKPDNPNVRRYFRALAQWELCFLNYHAFVNLFNAWNIAGEPVYKAGDGTSEERACEIANAVRHRSSDLKPGTSIDGEIYTLPVWLTNSGFSSARGWHLSFVELAALVDDAARVANDLQNPAAIVKNAKGASVPE